MPVIYHSTVEIDAKIKHLNEQVALFLRREKVSRNLLSHCTGISNSTIGKAVGVRGNPQTLTLLALTKILDFLEYDIVFVKRPEKETVWESPEKALILNQKRHEIRVREAARKAKRKSGPHVKVKHPRSVTAGRYEAKRQNDAAKREDDFLNPY